MSRRILVVDDDHQMVRTLRDILTLRGWTTDSAYSGEEAVEAVCAREYAAVLMDIRMGGMSGVEALRAMRVERPELQIILMTAYTASELLAEAERAGALRILPKPFAPDRLIALLDTLMRDPRSVLVVEDNPEFLSTVAMLLREHGFTVHEARTLDEALVMLERQAPGAVALDLRLPDVAPRDSVVSIRRVSPSVVLVLYSGYPHILADTTASIPSTWIRGALQKPFDPDRLIELLDVSTAQ